MKFALSPKKSSAPKNISEAKPTLNEPDDSVSPELVPIVTLLSAQTHRRYHEGIFMLYNDLNGDGNPADREWKEVYGILTGNQLAYWDAVSLAKFKNSPEQLLEASSKPTYLNFTDAVFNAMKVLPAAKQQLENVIIVSTTLKNRFIIQLKSYDSLKEWFVSLRLANFEYSSLQEAYTGALLSARGSRLSDIRTILAEKRFPHSDWVKIRYGSGMAWRRCYAVIEPSQNKKKGFSAGRVLLYDSENVKKKSLLGVISSATSVTAVYPQSPFFIDKSTIMKLEGSINFKSQGKKSDSDSQETSLFIMPEQHSSVPGFDTLIRFLVPLFDSFGLYGRPKRLKADRVDPESLVFGLPTLPHVHYLNSSDLYALTGSDACLSWDAAAWKENIKRVLKSKLAQGYDGCGSSRGFLGAVSSLNSPSLGSPTGSRVSSRSSPAQSKAPGHFGQGPTSHPSHPSHPSYPGQGYGAKAPGQGYGGPNGAGPNGTGHSGPGFSNGAGYGGPGGFGGVGNGGPGAAGAGLGIGIVPRLNPEASASTVSDKSLSFGLKNQSGGLNKNVNNLQIQPPSPERHSVQLADIYQKYSTIETPSDRFDDRNKILNGSAEQIDENHLPSLMRKKSLKNGPYPMSDSHLINSDESDDESEPSISDGDEDLLAVPSIGQNRNSSYSSVKSPLTQYNEFNKQFSKTVDHNPAHDRYESRSDSQRSENDSSSLASDEIPPIPPVHEKPFRQQSPVPIIPQQVAVPVIQQNSQMHSPTQHQSQLHTPSSGTKFNTEDYVQEHPNGSNGGSSQGFRPNQGLEGKPRYIQAPNSQMDRSEQTAPLRVPQRPQQSQPQHQGQPQHQTPPKHQGPPAQHQQYPNQPSNYQKGQPGYPQPYGNPANQNRSANGAAPQPSYHRGPPPAQQQYPNGPQGYPNRPQNRPPQRNEPGQRPPYQQPNQQPPYQQPPYQQQQKQPQYSQPHHQHPNQPAPPKHQQAAPPKQYQQAPPPQQYQQAPPHHQRPPHNGSTGNPNPGGSRHPYQARVASGGEAPYKTSVPQGVQTSMGLQAHSQPGTQNLRAYGDSNQYGYQANPSHPAQVPRNDPRFQNGSGYTRQY